MTPTPDILQFLPTDVTPNDIAGLLAILCSSVVTFIVTLTAGLRWLLNWLNKRKTDELPKVPSVDGRADELLDIALEKKIAFEKCQTERDVAVAALKEAEIRAQNQSEINQQLGTEIRAQKALIDGLKLDVAKLPVLESQLTALKVQVAGLSAEKSQWQTERDSLTARNKQLLEQYQEAIKANAPKPPPPEDGDTGRLLPSGD